MADQRVVLTTRLGALDRLSEPSDLVDGVVEPGAQPPANSDSAALQLAVGALAEAMMSYARLYTTAGLMFDDETRLIAAQHLTTFTQAMQVIGWLVPDVVGRELRVHEGLGCRCTCPACSLGACLCVRNSIDTVLHAWDGSAPFGSAILPERHEAEMLLAAWRLSELWPDRGITLRLDPREGSPLADTDVRSGDRILTVNGTNVAANRELQAALTAHGIGDEVRLEIERCSGEVITVKVRR